MGEVEKCIFCKCALEELEYGRYVSNGKRASEDFNKNLNICKDCLEELKLLLGLKGGKN